ncbi:MAG: hypothetical protein LAP21_12865 [Acidobacteriia bacterium]|nr:hypothetical protein [Terriglobia bacterium]
MSWTNAMPANWASAREVYGLKRPFNFKVAIPFLLNLCALISVFVVCVFMFFDNGLSIGTQRFYFFSYIICLLLIAAAFSKARKLSYAILCWCLIELSLGFASEGWQKRGAGTSLFPKNIVTRVNPDEAAFIYHPLLQIVPRPNYQYKINLDFKRIEKKAKAADVDVASLQGKEITFVHNSLGIRGKELTPEDLARGLIFVYGGSTTYDISATQGETWVEELQSELKNKYTVLNFGVVAHSTTEHLLDTAFYQDVVKKQPVCAIYYVGWNDIINAHIQNLDSAYADYHLLTTAVRKPSLSLAKYSPLIFLLNEVGRNRFDSVPQHANVLGKTPMTGSDERLEAIFAEHIKTIAAINHSRGIKTIFVGQMLNKKWPQGPNVWAPLVKQGDFPPLVERFNTVLRNATASIPAKYIDPGITNFGFGDFVDLGHFSALGARKFATLIAGDVDGYCR